MMLPWSAWFALGLTLLFACSSPAQNEHADTPTDEQDWTSHDWDGHDAWQQCAAMVNDYSGQPSAPCTVLWMCANEGALSDDDRSKLTQVIEETEGCEEP